MNVIVCVKQVPDTTEIKIDPVNKTLIRAGVPSILNPFDVYAVEAALRMKDADKNTKVYVTTMGPPLPAALRRLWLHHRISHGAHDARRKDHRDLRGHQRGAENGYFRLDGREIKRGWFLFSSYFLYQS